MLSSIEDVVVCCAVLSQGRVDGVGWLADERRGMSGEVVKWSVRWERAG